MIEAVKIKETRIPEWHITGPDIEEMKIDLVMPVSVDVEVENGTAEIYAREGYRDTPIEAKADWLDGDIIVSLKYFSEKCRLVIRPKGNLDCRVIWGEIIAVF